MKLDAEARELEYKAAKDRIFHGVTIFFIFAEIEKSDIVAKPTTDLMAVILNRSAAKSSQASKSRNDPDFDRSRFKTMNQAADTSQSQQPLKSFDDEFPVLKAIRK